MNWTDLLGYAASAMVLATFCMSSMLYLRLVAIGSNILFILFGSVAHIQPVLLLHLVLLPVNLARLRYRSEGKLTRPACCAVCVKDHHHADLSSAPMR
jgi:hypothetical protein